jgi:HTH-type transcriptional regulator/antitoxin HigA
MVKPIRNATDYRKSLERIYELMQSNVKSGSQEYDELELLSIIVQAYEREKFPLQKPNPIKAIEFRLEQSGIPASELTSILGGKTRKSEILSGKRKLSLRMIRSLNKKLNIPAESLIAEY